MNNNNVKFPGLKKFSKHIGFSENDLMEAYIIEKKYHKLILNEKDKILRKELYTKLYSDVHRIYYKNNVNMDPSKIPFARKALLYKKEIQNKSILEVGCGRGSFLISILKRFKYKKLTGLDVSLPPENVRNFYPDIEFVNADITDFKTKNKYDIVYSNHVLEHMGPLDLDSHLGSIKNALKPDGLVILNLPNRLFGPSDITRIVDFTYTNKTRAIGSHFFESTYEEVLNLLKKHGFDTFYSPIPNTYLRHLFPNFRINSKFIAKMELNINLIKLLYFFKIDGRCRLNYEISIIASCDSTQ
jgi:2-polyprenyl-3-methyl-5-hydroxy-6-metoxy-1,4-benzoquinol methylase